jgi:hypothetical protein
VYWKEVYLAIQQANVEASRAAPGALDDLAKRLGGSEEEGRRKMKATKHSRRELLETDQALGCAADLLLGMHRAIGSDHDRSMKCVKIESALDQLRGLVSSDVWSPTLGAVLAGRGEYLVEGEYAGDVLVKALDELTQRRNALCAQLLS